VGIFSTIIITHLYMTPKIASQYYSGLTQLVKLINRCAKRN